MILSEAVGGSLMYVVESLVVVLALAWRFFPPKRWWGHLLLLSGIVACFLGGFRIDNLGSHVAIVKIGASGQPVQKTRGRLYYGMTYTLQNGTTIRIEPAQSGLDWVVVNDSSRTLRLESQQYATSKAYALPNDRLETIAPFTVKTDGPPIDAIGPDERLPATTRGPLNETFLFHLTWDR